MLKNKLALLAATALITGVLAVPAFADVNVTVTVDKDKFTDVTVSVSITKDIDINVTMLTPLFGLAEAEALVNAVSSNNHVNLGLLNQVDDPATTDVNEADLNFTKRLASISNSLNNNVGSLIQLNQDVGDNANQGNVVSAALVDVTDNPATLDIVEGSVSHAEAVADQKSMNNRTEFEATLPTLDPNPPIPADFFHVRAEIINSVNDSSGVIMVNQNAGQNTNQHNLLALAVGVDAVVALAEGDLGQETSGNDVFDFTTFKRALIQGSVNGNEGIVAVNQATGHNNNQATVMTVAVTSAASALVPGGAPPPGL